jgi:V8-like Glu-specific endopeptidase
MSRRSHPAEPRVAARSVAPLAALAALLACAALLSLSALASSASAAPRAHAPAGASASSTAAEEAQVRAYWTRERMRNAAPLGGAGRTDPLALASFAPVADATLPPSTHNGRIFLRQGRNKGYCSGTAINSPSRRLVLTAGHCVNTGPRGRGGSNAWSRYLEFVPAYTDGAAPFGSFIARRPEVYAPKPWIKEGNPNFDMGVFLTGPNTSGVNVADAVGGGATIGFDLGRTESFQTFGYPGKVSRLQQCDSPSTGEDTLTRQIPGPPTVKIRCHWLPGASGGGWLIDNGTVVNGLTSYGRNRDTVHTFGPYFSSENVGALVAGL